MTPWEQYRAGLITKYRYRMIIGDEKSRVKKWIDENADRNRENNRRRVAAFRERNEGTNGYFERWEQASPPWLTDKHWKTMYLFYDVAKSMSESTGVQHVVDHIWPLKGQNSCGLNVPWNLQVVTQAENDSKGRTEPNDSEPLVKRAACILTAAINLLPTGGTLAESDECFHDIRSNR